MLGRRLCSELTTGLCVAAVLATLGCSESSTDEGSPQTSTQQEWLTLIEADWTLEPATEGYTCARATIPEDMYVSAFRPIAPVGTHHTLVTLGADRSGETEDTTFPCSAAVNAPTMLFGSGVGTEAVEFPEGVAIKLPKGEKILLNLHLFNVDTAPITGRSGLQVQRVLPEDFVHEAEIVLAGKIGGLSVVPGESTQLGSCPMSHDVTLFAAFPHMHQMGKHLKAVAKPAVGDARVLVDAPYSFDDQLYYPVNPTLELKTGDVVEVECTYDNPTSETIGFGDSSLKEMCFAGLFRYPKVTDSTGFVCGAGSGSRPTLDGPACAEEGAPGNEQGVGKHCTAEGGECGAGDLLCLADYTDGDFGNFCTTTCSDDASCGTGARCVGDGTSVCIPTGCEMPTPAPTDGGTL
jgi:hypothetical protein